MARGELSGDCAYSLLFVFVHSRDNRRAAFSSSRGIGAVRHDLRKKGGSGGAASVISRRFMLSKGCGNAAVLPSDFYAT